MNINPLIMSIGQEHGLPVAQDLYEGAETKFIVFTYVADDIVTVSADNEPVVEGCEVYVSLYVPKTFDYMELKDAIKRSLKDKGFTLSGTQVFLESDTQYRHIVFEVEYYKNIINN